ncbi:SH3 domain-containing protein [Umbelopsis sp. AD052]|nr:SH3 domain-containing protein [Umbelopsis sp. AD052]
MTELYRAHHSYEAQREDELSFTEGEEVRITNSDDAEWWEVEKVDGGSKGWVPSNFFTKADTAPNSEQGKNTTGSSTVLASVLEDYEAENHEELSLWKGGIVSVDDQSDDEWWHGDLNGKQGLFPKRNVKVIESKNEEEIASEGESEQAATSKPKNAFRLAAYGVKQGGIGAVMAGGFPLLKKTGKRPESVTEQQPPPLTNRQSMGRPPSTTKPDFALPQPPTNKPVTPISTPSSVPEEAGDAVAQSKKAIVINSYSATGDDEISLIAGEYVSIVDKTVDEGWWKGTNEREETGLFPTNFVKEIDEEPPLRPRRARPPTVKTTDSPPSEPLASPSLARPPPVPGSRPQSLISNRQSVGQDTFPTVGSPQSPIKPALPSVPSPRRPVSTPDTSRSPTKPRPVSMGMRSPDLPPPSPQHDRSSFMHPSRPSRPVPVPRMDSSETKADTLAKPPLQRSPSKMEPIQRTPSEIEAAPLPPSRAGRASMPPLARPPVPTVSPNGDGPVRGLGIKPRSMGTHQDSEQQAVTPPARKPSPPVDDGVNDKIHQLIEQAVSGIRAEFMEALEQERSEVLRLRAELEDLRKRLDG